MINFPELRQAWIDTETGEFLFSGKIFVARDPNTSYVVIHESKIIAEVISLKTCEGLYRSIPGSIPILMLPMGSMVTD